MTYESNTGLNVKAQYGPRPVGGTMGVERTAGIKNEASVNFDGDAFDLLVKIPAGAVVTHVMDEFATGAVTAATVGAVNIAAADGTELAYVAVPLGGDLTITGPTAGTVVVYFLNVA